mgnify:CR=1 FL=1
MYLAARLFPSNVPVMAAASNEKPTKPMQKVEMPPCSAELEIFGQNLYILFESAGQKYYEGTDGTMYHKTYQNLAALFASPNVVLEAAEGN